MRDGISATVLDWNIYPIFVSTLLLHPVFSEFLQRKLIYCDSNHGGTGAGERKVSTNPDTQKTFWGIGFQDIILNTRKFSLNLAYNLLSVVHRSKRLARQSKMYKVSARSTFLNIDFSVTFITKVHIWNPWSCSTSTKNAVK